jgi:lysophospholipase L1-like esterase
MFFKKLKTFIALMMVIMLVFSITAFAAAKQGVSYLAIGDSIAFGTGATDGIGYTDMFNTHLERKFGEGTYINLSQNGVTSDMILTDLSALLMGPYENQLVFRNADIITISIGGNDLLGPFMKEIEQIIEDFYTKEGVIDYQSFMSDFTKWEMDPLSQPQFNGMLVNLSAALPELVENFFENWAQIIYIIKVLNPTADIYVNTVFNPLKFSPALYDFADPAIQGLNMFIMGLAPDRYKVVDVYTKFDTFNNPKKLAVGDLSTFAMYKYPGYNGPVPLHPTDMGYKFIFNMHKDLMD